MAADKRFPQTEARMRTTLASALILWLALAPAALAQGSVCLPADSVTAALIAKVRRYSTATSGDDYKVRTALQLPSTSQVALVTNSTTCKKARDAFVAEYGAQGTGMPSSVYVVSVGSGAYAIVAPGYKYNGETGPSPWPFVYFVDSRFRKLSTLSGSG